MDSSRSSIRIQHTQHAPLGKAGSNSPAAEGRSPRFPKLDECAHFHYEHVELGALQVSLLSDQDLSLGSRLHSEDAENHSYTVQVSSQGKSWLLRRTYQNFRSLDTQLHRCIYDRKFSALPELPPEDNLQLPQGLDHEEAVQNLLCDYLNRFSTIAGNLINCGPVLSWLELDNRGRRLLVPDNDNCPINTPAVAAAYSVKRYSAQAQDEISFEVGDMISVIDMPPPEESVWWRGKRGFEVGFFPSDCVAVIGDKVPRNFQFSAGSSAPNSPRDMMLVSQPSKPVLRKHGKLIAFFRSFILSRPSRRRLKQSGILKERVFGCDLGEHLLNSGHDIPMVLKCCAEFIETNGIVDGIYRLSGVTSNIQKLRNTFDEDRVPGLYEDEAILQDIHSVASLLKMYFRELPNPLCTYQLYHQFVGAVQNKDGREGADEHRDSTRLMLMRDAVQKLPPPHYRTLQYLIKHLARVAEHGPQTGMTPRNVAIVWAPNLLRCKALEVGGVAALQGVGVQAVVTEFLICYADLIFCDRLPALSLPLQQVTPKRCRPKSLAISTPTKLLSLEEARTRALLSAAGKTDQEYIEVGGGPSSLPAKYHTVIDLPSRKRSGSKRSPLGWKSFFSKAGRSSGGSGTHSSRKAQQQQPPPQRKTSTPSEINFCTEKAVTESDIAPGRRRLRPVKSAESLASGNNSNRNSAALSHGSDAVTTNGCGLGSGSQPSSQAASPSDAQTQPPAKAGHNRSVSHDSYFDHLAETPLLSRQTSSRLHEEEEGFSSSLDLSEIQLNFELEESEMRIFSEDETLLSTFDSASILSQGSPHTSQASHAARDRFGRSSLGVGKRLPPQGLPHLARPEDTLSGGCASLDPSPKKQKTSSSVLISSSGNTASRVSSDTCKRSRLEEQLTSSAAELRYIDSQSPEQQSAQQQVLVQAEIHQPTSSSNNATSSNGTYSTLISASPSPAEAPISDNESTTLLSSGLTTPDTPLLLYSPLREDGESSGSGIGSTPDYENMSLSLSKLSPLEPRYEQLVAQSQTPSPSHESGHIPVPKPRFQAQRTPYENIQREFLAAEIIANQNSVSAPYENLRREFMIINTELPAAVSPPLSISVSPSLSAGTTAVRQLESSGEDDTLEVSQDNFSLDLNAGFDHIYTEIMSAKDSEVEGSDGCDMSTDSGDVEEHTNDYLTSDLMAQKSSLPTQEESSSDLMTSNTESIKNVYQNVPNPAVVELQKKHEDDVYEDFQFDKPDVIAANPECSVVSTPPLDSNAIIYQQVKYLRRSVHEVNALLEGCEASDAALLAQVQASASTDGLPDDQKFNHSGNERNDFILHPHENMDAGCVDQRQEEGYVEPVVPVREPCPETHFDCAYEETHFINDQSIGTPGTLAEHYESPTDESCKKPSEENSEDSCLTHCGFPLEKEPEPGSEFPVHCENMSIPEGAALSNTLVALSIDPAHCEKTDDMSSPAKCLPDSRRKFESEIGRELVRERRMTQELEEVRTASNSPHESPLQKKSDRNSKSSVRELLSRFEIPMESEMPSLATLSSPSPLPSRRSDPHPQGDRSEMSSATLPPCLRARAARIARTKLTSTVSLSASLDEDHFLRSGGSRGEGRALVRTQTEPDVNTENNAASDHDSLQHHSDDVRISDSTSMILSQGDDPQRRERIERYKEERRSFLREKYRSESFRNEQDDTLVRLKQKAVGKIGLVVVPVCDAHEDVPMEDDRVKQPKVPVESTLSETSKDVMVSPIKSPSKSRSAKSALASPGQDPITCVTVRQRIVTTDKVSLKDRDLPLSPKTSKADGQRFGFSPDRVSPEKISPERRFPERSRIPMSVELAQTERRPAQLVLVQRSSLPVASSERRLSTNNKQSCADSAAITSRNQSGDIRRRASSESSPVQRSPAKSPSYCIRDMAALFEAKETGRTAKNTSAGPNSTSSATGKQYLSSV